MKLTLGEKYLVDTNILVYALNKTSLFHIKSREILEAHNKESYFVVAQQNLIELVAVLTKQYKVSSKEAANIANTIAQNFEVIAPVGDTWDRFMHLVEKQNKRIAPFDIFLAATMLSHGVERIITANEADFKGFGLTEIITVSE